MYVTGNSVAGCSYSSFDFVVALVELSFTCVAYSNGELMEQFDDVICMSASGVSLIDASVKVE